MERYTSISIKNKLVTLMVLVSLIVVSLAALLLYQKEMSLLEQSTIDSERMQVTIIGASLESSIIFDDDLSATSILSLFSKNKYVEYAAVYMPDGDLFSEYNKSDNTPSPKLILPTQPSQILGENYLEMVDEITEQGTVVGYLYVRTSLDKLNNQRDYYRNILMYVIAFSILLALILSSYVQRIITQPLKIMVDYVNELSSSGEYQSRLDLNLKDELGTLAQGFNHLLEVVQERESALTEQSNNLQRLVDERTEQLYQKAHFDSLTTLPNRYLLTDRLEHAILKAQRSKDKLAILFMDLDRFKNINDSLGHDVGDELLKAAAYRLKNVGRTVDTIARLGGDEFVYLAESIDKPEHAGHIAEKIHEAFLQPFKIGQHILHVSTSIGICICPDDGIELTKLLKSADVSMYHAKALGPGNYCFFEASMNKEIHKRLEIENNLRSAIAKNELYLLYQPQTNLITNEIDKVEALIRWHNPELGMVSPAEFIPIAEEIGIINDIGIWVINEVCRQKSVWNNKLRIGINISSSQLLDMALFDYVKSTAQSHNVNIKELELEITEEVFLDHSARTINVLSELRAIGMSIAIDDFGTGYSSLRYLKNLPVDTLKLDGMFVMDVTDNTASQGIVTSTIMLAHSLNMKLVAECVETQAQLDYLKQQHCDYVQGYYLSKPIPADEVTALL